MSGLKFDGCPINTGSLSLHPRSLNNNPCICFSLPSQLIVNSSHGVHIILDTSSSKSQYPNEALSSLIENFARALSKLEAGVVTASIYR